MDFEIVETLRQSAKSTVLLVRDKESGQLFVQKTLQGRHSVYELLESCIHPYLPKLHEIAVAEDSAVIVEEYIEGETLDATLSEKEILAAMKELCTVLDFLHRKGIVHRDIKPSNLLMAKDGHIRLIDFDAARTVKDEVERDTRLLGTRGYAPPEQYGFAQTDARADVFAIGVTFGQLLGDRAIRRRYQKIIKKCTNLNPEKRYQSAKRVQRALASRGYVACTVLAVCVIGVLIGGLLFGGKVKPPYSDALFMAEQMDYILLDGKSITMDGKQVDMEVTLTPDQESTTFFISRDSPNGIKLMGIAAEYGQNFAYDDWVFLLPEEAFDYGGGITESFYAQISACDLDGDDRKEILVTIGDNMTHSATGIYSLTEEVKERPFAYRGGIGGMRSLTLRDDGTIYVPIGAQGRYDAYVYQDGKIIQTVSATE